MKEYRDHYFLKAKQENYPARSVYKLKEIDGRFKIFRKGMKVLDLGAATRRSVDSSKTFRWRRSSMWQRYDTRILAEPTKYYSIEGNNVYFELMHDGEPVDALDYLE